MFNDRPLLKIPLLILLMVVAIPTFALEVSVRSKSPFYQENEKDQVRLIVNVVNDSEEPIRGRLKLAVVDYYGSRVAERSKTVKMEPDTQVEKEFDIEMPGPGHYDLEVLMSGSNIQEATALSSFAVLKSWGREKPSQDSIFGLCGGALFHIPEPASEPLGEARLGAFQQLGCTWGRNDLWWSTIEPEKGRFDWQRADLTVDLFEKHGVNLLGILCYASAWSGGKAPNTPEEVQAFTEYVRRVVSRYKDRVHHWEVWNEPNLAEFWSPEPNVEDYVTLLKATYRTIKEVDSTATVIGGVVSGTGLRFYDRAFSLGALDYMDIVSIHPYQYEWNDTPGTPMSRAKLLEDLFRKYGSEKPVWITELGWPTEGRFTEKNQTNYLTKILLTSAAQPKMERIYWFNLTDWGPRGSKEGRHFGLLHMDRTPKPSFLAFRQLLWAESGTKYLGREQPVNGVVMHGFNSRLGRKQVRILWSTDGVKKVLVKTVGRESSFKVEDVIGNEISVDRKNPQMVHVEIAESPVYIVSYGPVTVVPVPEHQN